MKQSDYKKIEKVILNLCRTLPENTKGIDLLYQFLAGLSDEK